MNKKVLALFVIFGLATIPLLAKTIPYPDSGTVAPTNIFTAVNTGSVIGYFYGSSAGDTDYVGMLNLTTSTFSGWYFNNQTTAEGTSVDFGPVTAGDILVFKLWDTASGLQFASDPAFSYDGVNHAYSTPFAGGNGIPAGIFVGMEDLPIAGSDLDYNDDQFVFGNISSVPEPATVAIFGSGILGVGGFLRRKASQ